MEAVKEVVELRKLENNKHYLLMTQKGSGNLNESMYTDGIPILIEEDSISMIDHQSSIIMNKWLVLNATYVLIASRKDLIEGKTLFTNVDNNSILSNIIDASSENHDLITENNIPMVYTKKYF